MIQTVKNQKSLTESVLHFYVKTGALLVINFHFCQALHLSYNFFKWMSFVIVIFQFIHLAYEIKRHSGTIYENRGIVYKLLMFMAGIVFISIGGFAMNLDDTFYIPNIVYYLNNPNEPLNTDIHFFYTSDTTKAKSIVFNTSCAYDYIRTLPMSVFPGQLWIGCALTSSIGVCILFLTIYSWLRFLELSRNDAIKVLIIFLILLSIWLDARRSPGNTFAAMHMGRHFTQKLGSTLLSYYLINYYSTKKKTFLYSIFFLSIFSIGASSTTIFLFPLIVLCSYIGWVFSCQINLKESLKHLFYLCIAQSYVFAFGIVANLINNIDVGFYSPVNAGKPKHFFGHFKQFINYDSYYTIALFTFFLFVSIPCFTPVKSNLFTMKCLTEIMSKLRQRIYRIRFFSFNKLQIEELQPVNMGLIRQQHQGNINKLILIWIIAFCILVWNPISGNFHIRHTIGPNIFWRQFFTIPLLLILGIVSKYIYLFFNKKKFSLCIFLLCASFIALNCQWKPNSHILHNLNFDFKYNKLDKAFPKKEVKASYSIISKLPKGTMVAPDKIGWIIPIISDGFPQYTTKGSGNYSFLQSANMLFELENRKSLIQQIERTDYVDISEEFIYLIEEKHINHIILKTDNLAPDLQALLSRHGYTFVGKIQDYFIISNKEIHRENFR